MKISALFKATQNADASVKVEEDSTGTCCPSVVGTISYSFNFLLPAPSPDPVIQHWFLSICPHLG